MTQATTSSITFVVKRRSGVEAGCVRFLRTQQRALCSMPILYPGLDLRIGLGFLWKLMSASGFRVGEMSYLL
ncbi:hypothetical protein, partial [Rathayibacter sp. AY1E5]|uniref:hypothetical protein n=1 Tax=Rathayibacter sp. AY1E5 TaxID=2080553 RepID=UPI001CA59515